MVASDNRMETVAVLEKVKDKLTDQVYKEVIEALGRDFKRLGTEKFYDVSLIMPKVEKDIDNNNDEDDDLNVDMEEIKFVSRLYSFGNDGCTSYMKLINGSGTYQRFEQATVKKLFRNELLDTIFNDRCCVKLSHLHINLCICCLVKTTLIE